MIIARSIFMLVGLFFSGCLASDLLSADHMGDTPGAMLFCLVAASIFWTLFWALGKVEEP